MAFRAGAVLVGCVMPLLIESRVEAAFVRLVVTSIDVDEDGKQLTVYTVAARFDSPSDAVIMAYQLGSEKPENFKGFWHRDLATAPNDDAEPVLAWCDWSAGPGTWTTLNVADLPGAPKKTGQFEAVDRLARGHGLRLVPNAMPGYDDTPLRGVGRVTINRRRGDFYRESFQVAAPFVDDEQPMLLITSFNEWHEGTELEPSDEYGEKYLDLTRDLVAPLRGRRPPER